MDKVSEMAQCSTNSYQELSVGLFQKPAEDSKQFDGEHNQDVFRTSLPILYKMLQNINQEKLLNLASTLPENYLTSSDEKCDDKGASGKKAEKLEDMKDLKISSKSGSSALLHKLKARNVPLKVQIPRFSLIEFHKHPESENSPGLLQICCEEKQSVYNVIDNNYCECHYSHHCHFHSSFEDNFTFFSI